MTHETAIALSADLIAEGISHTVEVGWHENMNPPVQCRVDVALPRRYSGGLSAAIRTLEVIGETHGLVLAHGFMGNDLTFSTPDKTAGAFLRDLPKEAA